MAMTIEGTPAGVVGLVAGSALHEDGAAVAGAAGIDDGSDVLVHQVLVERLLEGDALRDLFAAEARLLAGNFVLRDLAELLVVIAFEARPRTAA